MSSIRFPSVHRRRLQTAGIVLAVLGTLSAAPPAPPDDSIRQGNQALERGEFDEALRLYRQAEERGTDPGLIAFNKATAYYKLEDYRQAENHYRMALDDAAISAERRAKALYDLGNCLVRQADEKDFKTLRDAIGCYELCLDGSPEQALRDDAGHNLEVAKLLWNQARSMLAQPPPPNAEDTPDSQRPRDRKKGPANKDDGNSTDPSNAGKDPKTKEPANKKDQKGVEGKEGPKQPDLAPKPSPSRVPVIPDKDELAPLSEDVRDILAHAEERLRKERENNRKGFATPENSSGRDW